MGFDKENLLRYTLDIHLKDTVMTATISTWGNSQGLRFPKSIMQELQLHVGDKLNIFVKNNKIIIEPTAHKREIIDINSLIKNMPQDYLVAEEFDNINGNEEW